MSKFRTVARFSLLLFIVGFSTGCENKCPFVDGDRVSSAITGKVGTVIHVAVQGRLTSSCYVAVSFDDGAVSESPAGAVVVDGDPRHIPNWELRRAAE